MSHKQQTILVGLGTCGTSVGAAEVYSSLKSELASLNLGDAIQVKATGCHGFCQQEPTVVIEPEGIFYSNVEPNDIPDIVQSLLPGAKPVEQLIYHNPALARHKPYYHDIPCSY